MIMYELYKLIDAYLNYQHPRKYNQDPAGFATLRGEFLCMSSPALDSVIEARPEKKLCSTHTSWMVPSLRIRHRKDPRLSSATG